MSSEQKARWLNRQQQAETPTGDRTVQIELSRSNRQGHHDEGDPFLKIARTYKLAESSEVLGRCRSRSKCLLVSTITWWTFSEILSGQ